MTTLNLHEIPWLPGRLHYRVSEVDVRIARQSILEAETNCRRTKERTNECVKTKLELYDR